MRSGSLITNTSRPAALHCLSTHACISWTKSIYSVPSCKLFLHSEANTSCTRSPCSCFIPCYATVFPTNTCLCTCSPTEATSDCIAITSSSANAMLTTFSPYAIEVYTTHILGAPYLSGLLPLLGQRSHCRCRCRCRCRCCCRFRYPGRSCLCSTWADDS